MLEAAQRIEIIAHRGASWDAPENTLAAVELAWRQGADAVEADFRLTADGRIVASHDDSTLRLAGVDLRIHESSLAELRALEFGGSRRGRIPGDRLPEQPIATLDQLLATLPPGKRFYVEIKCGVEIAEPLSATVSALGVPAEQIVLICFSTTVLQAVRRLIPAAPTYLVVEFLQDPRNGAWFPDADAMLAEAAQAGLTGLNLMAARIDAGLAARVKRAGLDVCCWTVDSQEEARRLLALGVRRITTNRPGWLRERLGPAGQESVGRGEG